MLEKFRQLAEQAAASISRRQLFGQLGRGAMLAATFAGSMFTNPEKASAGRRACDNATSDVSCWNRNVGDFCLDGQGAAGRCKGVRGSSACICSAR
jgi:hypothetical protein